MSNSWLRWYIGTCEDGKFRMISRNATNALSGNGGNAKVTVGNAIALWSLLLEDASHPDHRGVCVRGEDFYGAILDLEFEEIVKILSAMEQVKMISVGHGNITICNWNKRQFEIDSKDPTNTERQRRYKEKQKQNTIETISNGSVTVEKHQIQNTDTDTDTEKNYKKNITKKVPLEGFETFWEAFPRQRRGNKQKAEAAYRQALSRCSPAEVLAGLTAYADSAEVAEGFAKGAASWLNDDRWGSDYSIVIQSQTVKSFDQQNKDKTDLAVAEARKKYANPS